MNLQKKYLIVFTFLLVLTSGSAQEVVNETQTVTLLQTSKSWNGNELPEYPVGKPEVTIIKITIPPKTRLKIHKHTVINAGILIKGELTVVTQQNDTLLLKTGDAISEVVETWHYGMNNGNVPAEIIVFYTGIKGEAHTVLKDVQSFE